MNSTILSTKVLSPSQKSLILNAGLQLIEYNAIAVTHLTFELPKTPFDALIFTSQNAIKAFFESQSAEHIDITEAFCVGEKTSALLEDFGVNVSVTVDNAEKLGGLIAKNHQKKTFLFLSGKQRLDTLPGLLQKNNIQHKEVHVYETNLVPKHIDRNFDGVLFFSPSAVESYFQKNKLENGIAFCIGPTTETTAKKYTQKTNIANKPTIENVIARAIKQLKTDSILKNTGAM